MSKLYATLENSKGKVVSLSDNETITATVYEGNKKQYSITIDFGDIGDMFDNDGNTLPDSKRTLGSILSVRDWRKE